LKPVFPQAFGRPHRLNGAFYVYPVWPHRLNGAFDVYPVWAFNWTHEMGASWTRMMMKMYADPSHIAEPVIDSATL
jgi:hypothetical protein